MDFLNHRYASGREVRVAVVGGGDEMITKKAVSGREVRGGHRRVAVGVQGDIRGQRRRNRCKILVSEIDKRHRP